MAEIITCPACARKLQVPESFFGQMVQCPDCAHQFVADPHVQNVQSAPPLAASSAPAPADPEPEDRPRRRRRESYADDEFDDDDFNDMRPLRRSSVPHRGGIILALGIISLVTFPYTTWICGPLAWVLGNADLSEIRAGRMDPAGEGMVQAGRVLGMISTILLLGIVLFICLIVGFAVLAGRR